MENVEVSRLREVLNDVREELNQGVCLLGSASECLLNALQMINQTTLSSPQSRKRVQKSLPVCPMVSGHMIQKPRVTLQRVKLVPTVMVSETRLPEQPLEQRNHQVVLSPILEEKGRVKSRLGKRRSNKASTDATGAGCDKGAGPSTGSNGLREVELLGKEPVVRLRDVASFMGQLIPSVSQMHRRLSGLLESDEDTGGTTREEDEGVNELREGMCSTRIKRWRGEWAEADQSGLELEPTPPEADQAQTEPDQPSTSHATYRPSELHLSVKSVNISVEEDGQGRRSPSSDSSGSFLGFPLEPTAQVSSPQPRSKPVADSVDVVVIQESTKITMRMEQAQKEKSNTEAKTIPRRQNRQRSTMNKGQQPQKSQKQEASTKKTKSLRSSAKATDLNLSPALRSSGVMTRRQAQKKSSSRAPSSPREAKEPNLSVRRTRSKKNPVSSSKVKD